MIKYSVDLDIDAVSELVRQSLIHDYSMIKNATFAKAGKSSHKERQLLDSLETLIEFYSSPLQLEEWKKNR